jgi:hypothetical protein
VLESRRPLADVKLLADWALERGLELPDLDVRRPSLEDVYLLGRRGDSVRAMAQHLAARVRRPRPYWMSVRS